MEAYATMGEIVAVFEAEWGTGRRSGWRDGRTTERLRLPRLRWPAVTATLWNGPVVSRAG